MVPFTISTTPSWGPKGWDEQPAWNELCTGMVVDNHFFDEEGNLQPHILAGQHGLVTAVELQDIGKEGIEELIGLHTYKFAPTKDAFYRIIMQEVSSTHGLLFLVWW